MLCIDEWMSVAFAGPKLAHLHISPIVSCLCPLNWGTHGMMRMFWRCGISYGSIPTPKFQPHGKMICINLMQNLETLWAVDEAQM